MCSQPDYCFLAELTVFPGDEDSLTLHVIASQKQRALLFMFLEFCLSSFGFLNFERGIICSQTLPPCYLSKIFQNLTTYSSQTCFIFHSQKQYCSCQDAVSFPNEVFNQGPSGGLCYSNVSKMMLVLKNTTRQFTSNGLVSLGPHP